MGGTAGRRGKGAEDKLEEQKVGAHHLTRLERMGHIFSEHDAHSQPDQKLRILLGVCFVDFSIVKYE